MGIFIKKQDISPDVSPPIAYCQEEKKLVTVQWKTGATYVPGDQNWHHQWGRDGYALPEVIPEDTVSPGPQQSSWECTTSIYSWGSIRQKQIK